jgi:hypothetical protein
LTETPNEQLQVPKSTQKEDSPGKLPTKPPEKEQLPVKHLIKAMMAEIREQMANGIRGKIFCLEAMFPIRDEDIHPLMVYKSTSDPDTMYLHKAMKEPDKKEFVKAM